MRAGTRPRPTARDARPTASGQLRTRTGPRTTHHGQRPAGRASCARATAHGPGPMVRDYRPAAHGPRSASGTFTHHGARAMGPGFPGVPARYKADACTLFILATDNVRARAARFCKRKKTRPQGPGPQAQLGPRREAVRRAREFSRLRFQNRRGQRSIESSARMPWPRSRRPRAFQSDGPRR